MFINRSAFCLRKFVRILSGKRKQRVFTKMKDCSKLGLLENARSWIFFIEEDGGLWKERKKNRS